MVPCRCQTFKPSIYSFPGAGVDGFCAIVRTRQTAGAFEGGDVDRLGQDLEPDLLVLLNGLGQARFIRREPLLPSFFSEFFFATHNKNRFRLEV